MKNNDHDKKVLCNTHRQHIKQQRSKINTTIPRSVRINERNRETEAQQENNQQHER